MCQEKCGDDSIHVEDTWTPDAEETVTKTLGGVVIDDETC
jgi:hypothetical protein